MIIWYTRLIAIILFFTGLFGFFGGSIPHFVQLDLFQSFVYLIFGAVGLKLGFSSSTAPATRSRYATATGIFGLVLFLIGITFPNLFDIFHLEIPEHVFHLVIGVVGCLVGDKKDVNFC